MNIMKMNFPEYSLLLIWMGAQVGTVSSIMGRCEKCTTSNADKHKYSFFLFGLLAGWEEGRFKST
jgi:hypothetical protein